MPTDGSTILVGGTAGPNPADPGAQAATPEDFGFVSPAETGVWSPSYIPVWLQEVVRHFFFLLGDLRADQGNWICAEYVRFGPAGEWPRRGVPEWPSLGGGYAAHA